MSTMPVRIHEDTHRHQYFLKGLAADFAALRRDPAAWGEELREREAWDATLSDGLEGDPFNRSVLFVS